MYHKIQFQQAKELLDRQDCVLLDVREEEEYITGHAVGAQLLPLGELDEERAAEYIPTLQTPVLVYCRSGRRSFEAARRLEEFGYEQVYDIGSLIGWPYGLE